ncbi:MAG: Methionyl-tRNA formyltransferase [Chlorobi bacterium]|nr:MAG: methionyl-tRNA formyltransferase [Chlorobi bacterium OLB6]MBV6463817.1 Methionyl-tRNA formyltransferase [Chlorobiota bacterium]WKZ77631.1 MAG: methionyl-tRNA formyltransferase [Candidatus Kapabacteria bacterium]
MANQQLNSKPTIVFMGTPSFAVPALQALHAEYGVSCVVTVPDKPSGRGLRLTQSAIKEKSTHLGIHTILQPEKLTDPAFIEQLQSIHPDIICVIAFRILPARVYSTARLGAFNVHASLLPKYRGAAPINHAIINGEKETGVTSFLLNDVVDTGSILHQIRYPVPPGCTAGELYDALQPLAAQCAVETTGLLLAGTAKPRVQEEVLASPAHKVFRETSQISWERPTQTVSNFIHGLSPVPCAWTLWNNQILKIFRVTPAQAPCRHGEWTIQNRELFIGCSDGAVRIDEVQLPGKKRMNTANMLLGYRGASSGICTTKVNT